VTDEQKYSNFRLLTSYKVVYSVWQN